MMSDTSQIKHKFSYFEMMFIRIFFWILPKPFCPYCGANYITFRPSFYLVLPYYLHLLKCAKPHGISVKFGTWYDGRVGK